MKLSRIFFLFVLSILSTVIFNKALAHCDTMDGPVVKDAQAALEKKDVTPVLKWVKPEAEDEIRSAFQTALKEREKNAESKASIDKTFFETIIRVHRAGEGATFEGLKPAGSIEPIVAEADRGMEMGTANELTTKMSHHLAQEVKERFDRVIEKRKHKDESVKAGREYVEAYVEYMHYIEGVHQAILGKGGHHEEPAQKHSEKH